jgi:beta-lactamase regulating signal transducer with metallopeptidase domain
VSGFSSAWVNASGWMLLHSLWQGAAVAVALALALRLLRRAPAQARYLAACVAMALMIALPMAVFWQPQTIASVVLAPHAMHLQSERTGEPVDPEVLSTPAPHPWQTQIVTIFPAIVGLWMAGAGVLSLRVLGGWVLARRWVRCDTRALVCPWIDRLKARMGIRRAVALLESAHAEVPMVVGWLRPAILVPVAALSGLTAPELEAILAHELAHIRRHDYLVNILQCVVEVLMFYHPATWWITRVIRREREHCCDDMAVVASRDRRTYARALAAMEGLRAPAFSLSPAANGGNLLARVRRILEPEEVSMKPVRVLVSLAVVLAVAPICLTRADDQPAKADPATVRPPLNRITGTAGVRAEIKAWKEVLPIAEIEDTTTCRIPNPPLPFPNRFFTDLLTEIQDGSIGFVGNQFATDAQLKTKIGTRKPILGILGRYHRDTIDEARLKLIDYYQKQGFFEANVALVICPNSEGNAELTFVISEGPQYKVRNLIIEGNTKIKTEVLREGMELHSGKPFLDSVRNADKNRLLAKYYEIGYIEADVVIEPKFTAQHGVVDLLYRVSEGEPYLLGELEILKQHDLDKINDAEAEKTFGEGMYYKRIGKLAAAEFIFTKILQRWPDSPWAIKAKAQRLQIEPKPDGRTRVEYFNFLVGGFY